jgi:cytochrome P450
MSPSSGPHQCIGKGISQSEMRLVTAKLVKRYHVKFSAVHDPEAFVRDMRDQVTMMPGDLFCTFELRRND